MRITAGILALYFLALSFVPCADIVDLSTDDSKDQVCTIKVKDHCHDHDHQSEDGCTPLCYCQCCHTPFIFTILPIDANPKAHHYELTGYYTGLLSADHTHSILRPPQV